MKQEKKWESMGKNKPVPRVFDDDYKSCNRSTLQEKRIAKSIGGFRNPASGAIPGFKGDAQSNIFRCECKRTSANSMVLKMEDLMKIDKEAAAHDQIPCFAVKFEKMPVGVESQWIAIPLTVFEKIRSAL